MLTLAFPVTIFIPELIPIAVFKDPVVSFARALAPKAELPPMANLPLPFMISAKEFTPLLVLLIPVLPYILYYNKIKI